VKKFATGQSWQGRRELGHSGNILNFPSSNNHRFDVAVSHYARGEYNTALKEAIALIDEGYGHANTLAGAIYERGGDGVKQDYEKAKFYYQMAVDEVGAVEGWLALGRLHYFGKGMQPDYEKAFYYYSVVDQDTENAIAYLMLGQMYMEGKGVPKDLGKAREYFIKAENMGSIFALTYQGLLEMECGYYLKSLWLRLKAGYRAFLIAKRDPSDLRLRRS
jgi:TPR repeat protein